MVLAAGALRIPAALTEADAHLGLANRLAAPFARRVFFAFPIEGLEGPKYQVVGRPIPERSRSADQAAARQAFGLPAEGPVVLVFGGSQGSRRLNEAALEAFAEEGPAVLHLAGERDYPELARASAARDYRLLPFTDEFGAALAAADLVVARAGGSVWEVAAAGKPALLVPYPHATADHQDEERAVLRAGRRGGRRPRGGARSPPAGERAARRPGAARGDGRGDARAGEAGRGGRRRRGADGACPILTAAVSGSRASAAPAFPGTRSSRAPGAPRSPAGTARRRPTSRTCARPASRSPSPTEAPEPPAGAEVVVSTAYAGKVQGRSRAEFLAELVALRRSIVVAGAHGKTTTAAMIAYCLDRLGHDPSFLIGGEVPQLGGNARAGEGWLVVEGDESDGTVFSLPAEIAVVTNVDLDHHSEFSSLAELEEGFEAWAAASATDGRLGARRRAGRLRARRSRASTTA